MKKLKEQTKKPDCANLFVNSDGKLCELEKRGTFTVNKLFNCVRWDYDGSIKLSFNPNYISSIGW